MPSESSTRYTGISSYKCYLLVIIFAYFSVFFIFSTLAIYICLGIYFATNDYQIRELCPQSMLWEYVLLSTIFAGNKITIYFLNNFTKKNYYFINKVNIGTFLIELFLILMGSFSIFDHSIACNNDNTDLGKFGISSYILQICYLLYSFFMIIDYCVYGKHTPEKSIAPRIEDIVIPESVINITII